MKTIKGEKAWRVCSASFAFLLTLAITGDILTHEWSGYINPLLRVNDTAVVDEGTAKTDNVYYKSKYTNHQDVITAARTISKQAEAEGATLLANKNNALPLTKGSKITLFSYSSVDPVYGGTGSGGSTPTDERKIDLKEGCELDSRLSVNPTMYNFYQNKLNSGYLSKATNGVYSLTRKKGGGWGATATPISFTTPEVDPTEFTSEVTTSFQTYQDAAIFVMSRIGGEGSDLRTENASDATNTAKYLALQDNEKAVLQAMKDGPFKKRIVLLNTTNTPELGWMKDYNIDACLYVGGTGEVGFDAVGELLVGTLNPSGHTADTYAYDSYSAPAMQNFRSFAYANASEVTNSDSKYYLSYNEGIYIGYRYYETRYEDTILNQGNANSATGAFGSTTAWKYSTEVQFPFGYGLSYTSFSQDLTSVNVNESKKTATVNVKVTNAGTKSGKDVVEVYAQSPYTAGGIEKPAVSLAGFAKTSLLAAGATESLTITIDLNDIASYDYKNAKTYVMDKGDYYFAIGNGAHEAINNILAKKGKGTNDGMDEAGNPAKAYRWNKGSYDAAEYVLSINKRKVTNQFDSVDLNYYKSGSDLVTYLSRANWSGTYPMPLNGLTATKAMLNTIASYYDATGNNNPSAYTPGSTDTSSFKQGVSGILNVVSMRGLDYNDANWDSLLNQISLEEMAAFNRQGRTAIASVNMPSTTAIDGPAAWTKGAYKEQYDDYSSTAVVTTDKFVSYPIESVIACTWNVEIAKEIGDSFGEEGLWGAGVGWYGPAADIHRTPYAGRNFEYYSEDCFISGKLGEAEIHGAMAHGVIPYFKHFFMNDQETNRIGVCTFSNEQAIREVYLRAFQYGFSSDGTANDPACSGVMGAFNRLGLTWTGHYANLWKNVMQDEWGFTGNVTTDFGQKPQTLMDPLLAYEAGTTMFCTSGDSFEKIVLAKAPTDAKLYANLREATHRTLYNFASSFAMNGLSASAKIVKVRTWYNNAFTGLEIGSSIFLAVSIALLALSLIGKKKEAI